MELAFRMLEAQIDRYTATGRPAKPTQKCTAGRTDASCGAGSTGNHSTGSAGGVLRKRGGARCSGIQRNAAECPHNRTHNHTHHYNHTQTYNHAHVPTQDAGSEKPTLAPFSPPSVEEVRAYAKENKIDFDSAKFVDFYTANDWHLGTAKMKDWKLAVRVWSAAPAMQT